MTGIPLARTCANTGRLGMGNLLSEEEIATVVQRVPRDVSGTYDCLRVVSIKLLKWPTTEQVEKLLQTEACFI